ncbi:MAG: DUF1501 domain-containing protein [Erythrobacter sp.]
MIQRRTLLAGGMAASLTALASPALGQNVASGKRLIFVLLRGAADGLSMLAPTGDPMFTSQRGGLGQGFENGVKAGSDFAFHPSLTAIGDLYAKGQCLAHHAIATGYRERSHFDGQNMLESGGARPNILRSGWLNRGLSVIPQTTPRALAIAHSVPLALRGPEPVSTYAPSGVPEANDDLMRRVSSMYQNDQELSELWQSALTVRGMTAGDDLRNLRDAEKAGQLAASLVSGPSGAQVLMIELDGWDSHAGQVNQLKRKFSDFDTLISSLQRGLGREWDDTVMIVTTEFGRTVKPNPSNGTDHGTGAAALLLGGSVRGGRVLGDWPGLADGQLYEGRDLRPTASLESMLAGAVADQFGMVPKTAAQRMFPGRAITPMQDLLKT